MTAEKNGHSHARLALGPLFFHWPPEKIRDFYSRIADEAPVDTVYIGEVVCAKRTPLISAALDDARERLLQSGKEVVQSSLAIVADEKDMAQTAALVRERERLIEANDIAALSGLEGRPHVIGPFINVYNEDTLSHLSRCGAVRVCLPPELHKDAIAVLSAKTDVDLEVFAFGRAPLALSARCYHARVNKLHKDNCRFVCQQDPDGMAINTLTGDALFAVNGIQTLAFTYTCLLNELAQLREIGVNRFRLSPHDTDMVAVARIFRDTLDGAVSPQDAQSRLAELMPAAQFSNGFFHRREGVSFVEGGAVRMSEPARA